LQSCIYALALLCLSAIYDWGGPDNLQIMPIVGEVTLAVELHKQPPAYLSHEEKERRRLLFWGIYSMDRAGELRGVGYELNMTDMQSLETLGEDCSSRTRI